MGKVRQMKKYRGTGGFSPKPTVKCRHCGNRVPLSLTSICRKCGRKP